MSQPQQFCTFHLENLFIGIDVTRVQEVIRPQRMTPVPLSSKIIRGLINLRGQIVTAIDLRKRMCLSGESNDATAMNVIVRTEGGVASLLVDRIGDVIDVDPDTFERPPESLRGEARTLVSGVYKLKGKLLLTIDTEKVLNSDLKPNDPI